MLDLGCGTGFTTVSLAHLVGPTGKVIGIDHDLNKINFAKQIVARHFSQQASTIVYTVGNAIEGFPAFAPYSGKFVTTID